MAYKLRLATNQDFEFLRRLHRETLKPYVTELWGWDEARQEKLLRERFDPAKLQVIQQARLDVGVLHIDRRPTELFLANILILPGSQGVGLGTAIVRDLMAEARRLNVPITLTVLRPNPARKFYEKLGFTITGEDEFRYFMKA